MNSTDHYNARWLTVFYGGEIAPSYRLGFYTFFRDHSRFYFENQFLKEEFKNFMITTLKVSSFHMIDQIEISVLASLNNLYKNKGPYYSIKSSAPDYQLIMDGTHPSAD